MKASLTSESLVEMATAPSIQPPSTQPFTEKQLIDKLLELSLNPQSAAKNVLAFQQMSDTDRSEFLRLADMHHVIIRTLEPLSKAAVAAGDFELQRWANEAIAKETARVTNALTMLHEICSTLEASGCPVTVMKSLDHFPDLGSDLDLYTTAPSDRVISTMTGKLNAKLSPRSWGDRIAQKWNFEVPGLPESVEIHVQRLGQMGEHQGLAKRFNSRRVEKTVLGKTFYVPAPEERIVVATLQRMYRHFYFRVCDVVNSSAIVESGQLNFAELKKATDAVGIWPGVASYLMIVSDFVRKYRGRGLELPIDVIQASTCGASVIDVRKSFLRVPIVSCGAPLYTTQITKTSLNGNVPGTLRLALLPYLAAAAAVAYKVTGSDKGVW